ncbi:hypothetical protein HG535_0E02200 [Zygotorulaspora mrakii]|uniref:Peroxisome assembly protein 22 n=1 Tax=Zygotorulaspora mrakii TaxID=42260 RepID=A0A7H9B3Y2_ZYGMR|nr:uncharacterized protein HG535_0E02200 [Zygotorulaspora mrakii]QLG73136.1 hypothetical protein HG535_0E02200 [Zygotorulaspora mrakii]
MSSGRSRYSGSNWQKVACTATGIVFGITAVWYYAVRRTSKPDKTENERLSSFTSQCILMTPSISKLKTMDWSSVLKYDVVLLVPPEVEFLADTDLASNNNYKVLYCDTMSGLWSCIRHLRKHQLIYVSEDLQDTMPQDIPRYVKSIIDLKSNETLQYFNLK